VRKLVESISGASQIAANLLLCPLLLLVRCERELGSLRDARISRETHDAHYSSMRSNADSTFVPLESNTAAA
jgi:hypothetical protein